MISVIVPVYNVENYLDRCIKSLVSQTYTDIEIILIDDGSTDTSGTICDKWGSKYKNIKVIHQKNAGVSKSRNVGIQNAKGDYIGFIDADDYIESDMFESLINSLKDDASIAVSGYNRISENETETHISNSKLVVNRNEAIHRCLADDGWGLYIWNKLFARKLIINDNNRILFPEDLIIGEDAVWLISVLLNCQKVSYCRGLKYNYVQRSGSAVSQSKSKNKLYGCQSRYEASYRCYTLLQNNGLNKDSNLMLRRCVFSARDVTCELYTSKRDGIAEWHNKYKSCLLEYRKKVPLKSDFLFLCKNILLFYLVSCHAPINLVKAIL